MQLNKPINVGRSNLIFMISNLVRVVIFSICGLSFMNEVI